MGREMNDAAKILNMTGPILVIGASGFIGANILRACAAHRDDVVGTVFSGDSWRLQGIPAKNVEFLDLRHPASVKSVLARIEPKTIFDCASFGAYSFEMDWERIHVTNYLNFIGLMEELSDYDIAAYVHAGSSLEYRFNAYGPSRDQAHVPNSHYVVSKAAAALAVTWYGKTRSMPVINLRLYSVYGPYEDSSGLIPMVCEHSIRGELPTFGDPRTTRDFVYVDDVVNTFIHAASVIDPSLYGESFDIATGVRTSLAILADTVRELFDIHCDPKFNPSMGRAWDVDDWFADATQAQRLLGLQPQTPLRDGLVRTRTWWSEYLAHADFSRLTKRKQKQKEKNSISAIVACYNDGQAIPIMYERLVSLFNRLGIDYEIIFVNDNSPDESAEAIRAISARDPRVFGISHSRNFGSQAAFRSGMEMAGKEACVLLDGDLQDPPELIEQFVEKWREGADVVYGRRVRRDMPLWLEMFYRAFYRIFAAMSEIPVPKDAGDFSLIDRSVVHWMLQCGERDAFLRGLRAYVGFSQVAVDYVRPERMFGISTNNWIKNIGWAKKAIFSFSRMPLHALTACGALACAGTLILALATVVIRLVGPESVPKGITFLSLLVMFFGSASILGIGLLGEYIGKIFEETKARPPFIRRNFIIRGEVKAIDPGKRIT
jgi:polyisoprenyl-phosphate glycosyltransferase